MQVLNKQNVIKLLRTTCSDDCLSAQSIALPLPEHLQQAGQAQPQQTARCGARGGGYWDGKAVAYAKGRNEKIGD